MKPDKGKINLGNRDEKTGFLKSIEGKDVTEKDVLMIGQGKGSLR